MHMLTRLIITAGLDPNAPSTTRPNPGSIAGARPGQALDQAGKNALELGRAALWQWFLVALAAAGVVILLKRQARLQYIGAAVAGFVLVTVFVFQTEVLGDLLRGITGNVLGK